MGKVGPGKCGGVRRPEKLYRQAVLSRRLLTLGCYAANQMGKVEFRMYAVGGDFCGGSGCPLGGFSLPKRGRQAEARHHREKAVYPDVRTTP